MNWQAIGAVGEVGGAIAVVATLVYLAVQIRHGTRAARLAAAQTYKHDGQEMRLAIASDSELAEIFRRGLTEPDSLNETERSRFNVYVAASFDPMQFAYETHAEGIFDWDPHGTLAADIAQPGYRQWWEQGKAEKVDLTRSRGFSATVTRRPLRFS